MRRGTSPLTLLMACLLLFAACGGGEEVGEAFDEFEGGEMTGERIGEIRTTPTPVPETPPPVEDPTPPPEQPPAQPEEQPQQEQQPAVVVEITGAGYDPQLIRMFVGTKLEVRNTDGQARTYTAANRAFDSGDIPSGGSWTYVPQQTGKFDIEDKTRPYVTGSLEVVAR